MRESATVTTHKYIDESSVASQPDAAASEGGVGVSNNSECNSTVPPTHPGPTPHVADAELNATADATPAQDATPPPLTPDAAYDAVLELARTQFGERRLIDWIAANPGVPFPLVWVGKPDGTYHLHWLTRAERRTLPATRRGREAGTKPEKKLVLP